MGSANFEQEVFDVAREELGTKRLCPETGKKFYDLNKDPIISPYTGKQYERAMFEVGDTAKAKTEEPAAAKEPTKEAEENTEAEIETETDGPEIVSLEEAEEDSDTEDENDEEAIAEIPDVELEVEDDDESDEDAFLDDEDEDEDLSNVIGDVEGEEEV